MNCIWILTSTEFIITLIEKSNRFLTLFQDNFFFFTQVALGDTHFGMGCNNNIIYELYLDFDIHWIYNNPNWKK